MCCPAAHPALLCRQFTRNRAARQPFHPTCSAAFPRAQQALEQCPLSISDAINRALKYNLGSILSEQDIVSRERRGFERCLNCFPEVNAGVTETVQQINLAAFGFTSFPGVPQVIGPFSVFDARARYSQKPMDFRFLHELRSASERVTASNYAQQDVRELVVLITTDLYLEAVAGASRVDAARAQLKTAQAVNDRAMDLKDSGVIPGIDLLRAQVQLQQQQQRVLAAENDLAKQKLNLARAIGLPQAQDIHPERFFCDGDRRCFLRWIRLCRPPWSPGRIIAALAALVRAAEETRKAAIGRRLPSLQVNADYGDIGPDPGSFARDGDAAGNIAHSDLYRRASARRDHGIGGTAAKSERPKNPICAIGSNMKYAAPIWISSRQPNRSGSRRQARDLSQQQLTQAQDRFAAGVTNGLEVTQAQEAVVSC